MAWFTKKKAMHKIAETNRIDVVAQKNANKEVVAQAQEATRQLKELLDRNGFTIQIFLAAGGTTKTRTRKATK
jgi:hypothetical protein